ncbi:MAG: hypothetical protein ABEJ66_01955 [Candidatus Nanohaloarchaea archaeon]
MASREQTPAETSAGVESQFSSDYPDSGDILTVERSRDLDELSMEHVRSELEAMDEGRFYIGPQAFAKLLERDAGKLQPWIFDEDDGKVPDNPELPDYSVDAVEKVAEQLSGFDDLDGRIDVRLYDRDGDPKFIKTYEGKVSDQVFQHFERALSAEQDYAVELTPSGYTLEL